MFFLRFSSSAVSAEVIVVSAVLLRALRCRLAGDPLDVASAIAGAAGMNGAAGAEEKLAAAKG